MLSPPLPKVLIIDDEFGADMKMRADFCKRFRLLEATQSGAATPLANHYLAQAVFESGQSEENGHVKNDAEKVLDAVGNGAGPDNAGWALICVDLNFPVGPKERLRSEPFGCQIVERIRASERERRMPPAPIIILSSEQDFEGTFRRLMPHLGTFPFVPKWPEGHMDVAEIFGSLLFRHGLIEDNALRAYSRASKIVYRIDRDRPIFGKSRSILSALREVRQRLLESPDANFLFEGEPGTELDEIAHYWNDCRDAALNYLEKSKTAGLASASRADDAKTKHRATPNAGMLTNKISRNTDLSDHRLAGLLYFPEIDQHPNVADVPKYLGPHVSKRVQFLATHEISLKGSPDRDDQITQIRKYFKIVTVPSLAERRQDILVLFEDVLKIECKRQLTSEMHLDAEAASHVQQYAWPRNVRELRDVVARLVTSNPDCNQIILNDIKGAIADIAGKPKRGAIRSLAELLDEISKFQFENGEEDDAWPDIRRAVGHLVENLLTAGSAQKIPRTELGKTLGFIDPKDPDPSNNAKREIRAVCKLFGLHGPVVEAVLGARAYKEYVDVLLKSDAPT